MANGTEPASLATERRYLTSVFIDLVGYTALSEQLDPEDLRLLQRRYQNLALTVMERFGGFVAQFQGDGVVIYFGYPVAHENDAERAVRAALEFLDRLQNLDTHIRDGSSIPLTARIGIHTGLVLIGPELVSGGVAEFSAIGEAVNLAARLQAEAPPGTAVVSSDTAALARERFAFESLGSRAIKGLSRRVEIFRVVGPVQTSDARPRKPLPVGLTPIVGRQPSIDTIMKRWRMAQVQRCCQTVDIVGDAGIGKTRVVKEFCSHPELAGTTIIQANCHELFVNTPLYPLVSFLWARAGLTPDDDIDGRMQKISTLLDELAMNTEELRQILASLLGLLSAQAAEAVAPTSLLLKKKQYDFVIRAMRQVASHQPTVLWVEDAHWLDASSAELLQEIVAAVSDVPLLVVLTRRSFPNTVALPQPDEVVELKLLSNSEALEVATSMPGAQELPHALLARAVEAAEGVPLFLEQFMISLIEEQRRSPDTPKLAGVPLLLAEKMSGRLDRRPGARRIVQAAAVIGRSFAPAFLAALLQQEPHAVAEPLQALVEAEILLPRRYGAEIQYEFRHALLRRIAYESMLEPERRSTHLGVAAVLHERPEQTPPEVVAYHLTEAGEYREAIQAWLRAGRHAAERSAHVEAIQHLRSGIALLEKIPDPALQRQLELYLQVALMGSIIAAEGATSIGVSECCQRGLELCRQEPSPLALPFAFGQFTFTYCRGQVQEADALAHLFLSMAEKANSESGRVIGHRLLGTVLHGQGKASAAKEQLELSLQLYVPERDAATTFQFGQSTEVHTKSALCAVLFLLGDVDRALEVGVDALLSADMLRHPHSTAIPLNYVGGWIFGMCDASEHLLHSARRLLALSEQHRLTAFSGHGNALLGWAMVQRGQLEEGISSLQRGIKILDSIEFRTGLSGYLGLLADARRKQRDFAGAEEACARAATMLAASNFVWFEPELLRIEGLMVKETKGPREAEEILRKAVSRAQELAYPVLERRCLVSLKQLLGHADLEVEARLKELAYLGDLSQKVSSVMSRPADLLKA